MLRERLGTEGGRHHRGRPVSTTPDPTRRGPTYVCSPSSLPPGPDVRSCADLLFPQSFFPQSRCGSSATTPFLHLLPLGDQPCIQRDPTGHRREHTEPTDRTDAHPTERYSCTCTDAINRVHTPHTSTHGRTRLTPPPLSGGLVRGPETPTLFQSLLDSDRSTQQSRLSAAPAETRTN